MSRTGIKIPIPPGLWRAEVEIRIHDLRNRLRVMQEQPKESDRVLVTGVEAALQRAETAAGSTPCLFQRIGAWWTGSAITRAWESVHEAETKLIQMEPDEDVQATLPRLLGWIQRAMDKGPERRAHEKALRREMTKKKGGGLNRLLVRQALEDVIGANNRRYGNLRAFRNNLILVTTLLLILITTLAIWHLANPDVLELCSTIDGKTSCVTGGEKSAGPDVALIAIIGAVGGVLAIAFGLADTRTAPSRFDPRAWQVLLKPVAGAATALIAALLIQASLLFGPEVARSEETLLAWAAIFGFSQQLLTQFVDKRAGTIMSSDDGKAAGSGDSI